MTAHDECPMHGERTAYTWDHSPTEPGCICPTTTPDDATRAEAENEYTPTMTRKPLGQILTFWRPGSREWSWADEYGDLINHPVTDRIRKRVAAEGIEFADKIAPIMLGSDGRVWDGHHRIVLAIQEGIAHLNVEVISSPIPSPPPESAQTPDDAARAAATDQWPPGAHTRAFVYGAAWQRAQIAARRDEVARGMYEADANKALEMGYNGWPMWSRADEITRSVYARRASAALTVLGVDR